MNQMCDAQGSTEIGSGSPRKPKVVLESFWKAIEYTEEALKAGTPAEEIEENLLQLYTPVARQEYGTRRHQMTFVSVVIAAQALKTVEALQARVAALESTPAPVSNKPVRKKKDQLKRAIKKRPTKKAKRTTRKKMF